VRWDGSVGRMSAERTSAWRTRAIRDALRHHPAHHLPATRPLNPQSPPCASLSAPACKRRLRRKCRSARPGNDYDPLAADTPSTSSGRWGRLPSKSDGAGDIPRCVQQRDDCITVTNAHRRRPVLCTASMCVTAWQTSRPACAIDAPISSMPLPASIPIKDETVAASASDPRMLDESRFGDVHARAPSAPIMGSTPGVNVCVRASALVWRVGAMTRTLLPPPASASIMLPRLLPFRPMRVVLGTHCHGWRMQRAPGRSLAPTWTPLYRGARCAAAPRSRMRRCMPSTTLKARLAVLHTAACPQRR